MEKSSNLIYANESATEKMHKGIITAIIPLRDNRLATASTDCKIIIWKIEEGKAIAIHETTSKHTSKKPPENPGFITSFNLFSNYLVGVTSDRVELQKWNIKESYQRDEESLGGNAIRCLTEVDKDILVMGCDDMTAKVWNFKAGKHLDKILIGHTSSVNCAAIIKFSKFNQEKLLATGARKGEGQIDDDPTIRIWNLQTGECIKTLKEHTAGIVSLISLSDGRIVSASADKTIKIWDINTEKCIHSIEVDQGIANLALLSNNCLVSAGGHEIILWDLSTYKLIEVYKVNNASIQNMVVMPDKSIVIANNFQTAIPGQYFGQLIVYSKAPTNKLYRNNSMEVSNTNLSKQVYADVLAEAIEEEANTNYSCSWHFSSHLHQIASSAAKKENFALIPAAPEDIGKVVSHYLHHPVPKMDLKRVDVIYNPQQNRIFAGMIKLLEDRAHPSTNNAFKPNWPTEHDPDWRKQTDILCKSLAQPYMDITYPNVKLLPMWHGTKPEILESLFRTGYANLKTTDTGYFGSGIYSTFEAEYSYRVYSKGPLIFNWVCFFSAYPTIDGDMQKLEGKGNYQNYDAHFVPVVPATNNPAEVNYFPTKPNQTHTYLELVVFNHQQCLPRYLVELQPSLPKAPISLSNNPHALFKKTKTMHVTYINLLAAAEFVYENYLNKPYTLMTNTQDWMLQHNGKIVYRPNHGLAHTLRTLFYVPKIVEYYVAYNSDKLSRQEKKLLNYSINEIQLALLFFVAGRENESGSFDDPAAYKRYRENSANAFEQYVNHANIKLNHHTLAFYKNVILDAKFGNSHIHTIVRIAHDIDTLRCFNTNIYNSVCQAIYPYIGKLYCNELVKLVHHSLEVTGDRIIGTNANQMRDYNKNLFVSVCKDVKNCMEALHKVLVSNELALTQLKL